MADAPMTFPIPLPVILREEEKKESDKKPKDPIPVYNVEPPEEKQEEEITNIYSVLKLVWDKIKKSQTLDKLNLKIAQAWDKFGIKNFASGMLKGFKSLGSAIAKLGGGFLDALMGLLVLTFIDPSGSFLTSLIGLFANLVVWLIGALANVIPKVIPLIVKLIPVLIQALSKILLAVVDLLPVIIDALIDGLPILFGAIVQAVPKIVDALGQAFNKIFNTLETRFPALKPIFDFFRNTAKLIGDFFSGDTFKNIMSSFSGLSKTFDGFLPILKSIGDVFSKLFDSTILSFEKMSPYFQNFQGVFNSLGNTFSVLGSSLSALLPIVQKVGDFILDKVSKIFIELSPLIVDFITMVSEFVSEAVPPLIEGIENLVSVFMPIVDFLIDLLIPIIKFLGFTFLFFFKILAKTVTFVIKMINGLITGFKMLVDAIKKTWDFMSDLFSGKFDIGQSISRAIKSAFENIPGMGKIREWFEQLANWFEKSWIGQAIKKMGGGSSEKFVEVSEMQTYLKSMKVESNEKIVEAFKNMVVYGATVEQAKAKLQATGSVKSDDLEQLAKLFAEESRKARDAGVMKDELITFDEIKPYLKSIAENTGKQNISLSGYTPSKTGGK